MNEHVDSPPLTRIERQFGPSELSTLVSGAPFLEGLAPEWVAEVAAACELVHIAGDQQLLSRDVPNDSLYVVVHGGLRVVARDEHGRERVISESYRGDSIGLPGLVPRVSAPADVFAIRDSVVLRLRRERFRALGERNPELVMRLAEGIARRGLQLMGQQAEWTRWRRPRAAAQNVALLVPSRDRCFAPAASDLARAALERYRRLAWITRHSLDQAFGGGTSFQSEERILAFLEDLEARSEIVVYACDTTDLPWSERCLRQADHIVVIVRADQVDHFAEISDVLARIQARQQLPKIDLALAHPDGAEVPGPSAMDLAWLGQNARTHHIRIRHREDYERLARSVIRSGVALVLSGGGARGIAHIGVLKALEEAQVPVDCIAGTSMGSIFAAAYARGWQADSQLAMVRDLFRSRIALYDPTFPFEALLAGRKFERVLRRYFDGLDIERLWVPFFCVSTNLSRAEPHVHDRGELWRAVAASCSIPGIFPPRREGQDQLVDGGIMDNLPVGLMAARFEGAILASEVRLYGERTPEQARSPSLLRQLLRYLGFRQANPGPGIFETLVRASIVGGQHATLASLARGEASLHLRLPVGRFGVLDWRAHDELYAVGYESARQQLASWQPPWRRSTVSPSGA